MGKPAVSLPVTVLPMTMTFRIELVTPELAASYLQLNFPDNRQPKRMKIELMRRDMLAGAWEITHQGIAFDEDGWLVDGQNRLNAIVEAGVAVPLLVAREVPRKAVRGVDLGSARTVTDIAHISGDHDVQHAHVAVARRMYGSMSADESKLSPAEVIKFMETHWAAITFALEHLPGGKVRVNSAPPRATVARAWYSAPHERLAQFCKCLITGFYDNLAEDEAAIRLRNFLMSERPTRGQGESLVAYAKSVRALRAFVDRQPLANIYEAREELFLLPGEVHKPRVVNPTKVPRVTAPDPQL